MLREPDRQAQVDFGRFGTIEMDGRTRNLNAFSYVLGYSRYRYAKFITDLRPLNLVKLQMNAFLYIGGTTRKKL